MVLSMRILLFLLALPLMACAPSTTQTLDDPGAACSGEGTDPGNCPPDFTLPLADGSGDFTLSDLVGTTRVVVIGTSNW